MFRKYQTENKSRRVELAPLQNAASGSQTSVDDKPTINGHSVLPCIAPVPPPPPPLPGQPDQTAISLKPKSETPGDGAQSDAEKKAIEEARKQKALEQKKMLDDLLRQANEIEAMIRSKMKEPVTSMKGTVLEMNSKALIGDVTMTCPSPAKIVRIFTSSTFTDTKHERNFLMRFGYPKIKEHCRKIGYEFQVVDMRWGVRDEATDDHMGTELCLKELKLCQKLSTGPNFVSLLSHKYGYTAFPRVIEAMEYETIVNEIEDDTTRRLFHKWYKLDHNMLPSSYVLASISTHLPDFVSNDTEKQKVAKNTWWEENGKMQDALEVTAKKVFDEEKARKYVMSVTETEVQEGILNVKNASSTSLWLKREIEDIDKQESGYALSRFRECMGPEERVKRSRQMLEELKEDKMKKKLDPNKILNYFVNWSSDGGINPETMEQHKNYLNTMCDDFVKYMVDMIDKSVKQKTLVKDPLIEECLQHVRFCQDKVAGFHGRQETLQQIKSYLLDPKATDPLVLHGSSGTGKTSIVAMAAKEIKTWLNEKAVVVLRFLGTTPDSSSLLSLLNSLIAQIKTVYRLPKRDASDNIDILKLDFILTLKKGRSQQPLVLVLDSLDQLDVMHESHMMAWLPALLPPGTKIIVSTLPEPQYQCFQALQAKIKDEAQFIDVPVLGADTVKSILDSWFQGRNRTLTSTQMDIVLTAFEKCPTPLFLKLSFEAAVQWTSFAPLDKTVLQDTVRASIEHLFERLEKFHGKQLVSRALGYLTIAKNGATEAELEDILSCDDDVLNDVYMYWTPPMRRLPPLLLVRIRTDISQYLVERGTDGVRVIYWYHRQFIEAAEARYCSDDKLNTLLHGNLADFFHGTWANGRQKPYTNKSGQSLEEDRHVSSQPLKYAANDFNLRSLNNLPYHRLKAGQVELLKEECLTNVNFAVTKLEALPVMALLEDYTVASTTFPEDEQIKSILEALLLSRKGLQTSAGQFVPQLLGRLTENDVTRGFFQKLRASQVTFIEPSTQVLVKPGGQLVHCINAHNTDVDMMDLNSDGTIAVTVCQSEKTTFLWDVVTATKKRQVGSLQQVLAAHFCNDDKWLVYETDKVITVEDVETGARQLSLKTPGSTMHTSMCVAGEHKHLLVIFHKRAVAVYDLTQNGARVNTVIAPEKISFDAQSKPYATKSKVAVLDNEQYHITVLDIATMTFTPKFRGFEKIPLDDGDFDEHDVEVVVIDPDETFLVYTNMFTNEIVFADFTGKKLRTIPPDEEKSINSLHITPDGKHLYGHTNKTLFVYDMNTLELVETLEHNKDLLDGRTNDMKRVVTMAEDSCLRIWDLTREKQDLMDESKEGSLAPIITYSSYIPIGHGGCFFLDGSIGAGDEHKSTRMLAVYDVQQQKYVKQRLFTGLGSVRFKIYLADKTHVVMEMQRKLYLIDLDTMEITLTFQGVIGRCDRSIVVTPKHKVVCTSRSLKNIKLYDVKTGKVDAVLKGGQTQKIDSFMVNEPGTMLSVKTDEGPVMLFNLETKCHLHNIFDPKVYGEYFGDYCWMNPEGTRFFFNIDMSLEELGPKSDTIDHILAWDVAEKKVLFKLADVKTQEIYQRTKSDESTSVESLYKLDDERLLTISYDNVARIYSMDSGELLGRLKGHTTSITIALSQKSPYIVTYGSFSEEDCIRLWDKATYKHVASFNMETSMDKLDWNAEGSYFYSTTNRARAGNDSSHVVKWRVHYGHEHVTPDTPVAQASEIFSSQVEFEPFEVQVPAEVGKDYTMEEGDPDTDVEVWTDSEDDDDDDDE